MAVKVPITVEGNLGADPEYGVKDDRPYARLMVIENDRRFNDDTKEWEDVGEPIIHNAVVFGRQAENAAATFHKGDQVIVAGDLHFQSYVKDGQRRQGTQIVANAVGPSLRYATAIIEKNPRGNAPVADVTATGPVATPDPAWAVAPIQA